ncbi:Smr/MutS family protein [Pendulispora rubella]|uniref:Endonuclease MutS2 n=1 Tax=Pendulispora rubella TaxID=2741070 RepID=A0ABZ2KV88_9BACT
MSAEYPTSPALEAAAPAKTRADLEWDRILSAVAERCQGDMGKADALSLSFARTREEVHARLAEAKEAHSCLLAGEPLPASATFDVTEAVQRLKVGGALGPIELRGIGGMLTAARALRRFLHARRTTLPALYAACATDPTLDGLAEEVAGAFDPDGTLSDRASPALGRLRAERQAARQRMLARLEDLMVRYERVLQDKFVTEREGRYVLPVRSDAHERFPGLVHATSASGSTIFVEPRAVIPMGNRLKMLDAEVEREEIAVYTRLSTLLGDALASLDACRAAIARADVLAAIAQLAEELGLVFPNVVDEPRLDLKKARHPLLALDGTKVVASDLAIGAGHAVVVSGPNAGGKTVALKTMGLAALMVRAGLPVACDPGSVVGIFDVVVSDVGDDQNLSKNLSTFSAHVSNLRDILDAAHRGALVLLDELAGGTDPREGEALAAGVLDSLCARGGAVVVTTHYEGLKALALADERFQNASVGFDLTTMEPTFRVTIGIPGSSSALAVARRFGMPGTVIERAERFLSREDQSFETLVKRLHEERAALELARSAATTREREADEARARLEAEIARTRDQEARVVSREAEALLASLRRAKDDLREAQARLRAKKLDEAQLRDAERAIQRVSSAVALGGELEPVVRAREARERGEAAERRPLAPGEVRRGTRVYVPRLRAEAEVVEVSGEWIRVSAGVLKLNVPLSELRSAAPAEPVAPAKPAPGTPATGEARRDPAIATSDNTCDLRGLRVDDALGLATSFLDRCLNERRSVAFLLHGHGTGALRDALRKELKSSSYVAHMRSGTQEEGGDGVTVVWLS